MYPMVSLLCNKLGVEMMDYLIPVLIGVSVAIEESLLKSLKIQLDSNVLLTTSLQKIMSMLVLELESTSILDQGMKTIKKNNKMMSGSFSITLDQTD